MKKLLDSILIITTLLFLQNLNAQNSFQKIWGEPSSLDYFTSVKATSDGGFILIGDSVPNSNGESDVWLMKTDNDGKEIWSKFYGTTLDETGIEIFVLEDGFLLLVEVRDQFYAFNDPASILFMKTDFDGNLLWKRNTQILTFDGYYKVDLLNNGDILFLSMSSIFPQMTLFSPEIEKLWSKDLSSCGENSPALALMATTEGGFCVTTSCPRAPSIVRKFNKEGEQEWYHTESGGSSSYSIYENIYEDKSGDLFLTGYRKVLNDYESHILKLDSSGELKSKWYYLHEELGHFTYSWKSFKDLAKISEDTLLLMLEIGGDNFFIKINQDGTILSSYEPFTSTQLDDISNLLITEENNLVLVGKRRVLSGSGIYYVPDEKNGVFTKLDLDFNTINFKVYGENGENPNEEIWDVIETQDCGFLLMGQRYVDHENLIDVELTKVNSSGDFEWSKPFGTNRDDVPISFEQTSSGTFLLSSIQAFISNESGFRIWEVDEKGNELWSKYFEFEGHISEIPFIKLLKDGHFLAQIEILIDSQRDKKLVKFDQEGNIFWELNITDLNIGAVEEDELGLLTTGIQDRKLYIINPENGEITFEKRFSSIIASFHAFRRYDDTTFMVPADGFSSSLGFQGAFIFEFNTDFEIRKTHTFPHPTGGNFDVVDFKKTKDNRLIIFSKDKPGRVKTLEEGFIHATSPTKQLLWEELLTKDYRVVLNNVIATQDGGIMAVGYQEKNYSRDFFMMKTTRLGDVFNAPNIEVKKGFDFYPNPAKDHIFVVFESEKHGILEVQYFDMTGRLMKTETINSDFPNRTFCLSVEDLQNQFYFLSIENEGDVTTKKILIQR